MLICTIKKEQMQIALIHFVVEIVLVSLQPLTLVLNIGVAILLVTLLSKPLKLLLIILEEQCSKTLILLFGLEILSIIDFKT